MVLLLALSAKTDLIDGTNILPFQARYIALGQSVAGTANADATFKVQYLNTAGFMFIDL
ncbi:hypothetical protein EIMP300_52450 [Escherichia coli]|uniref:Uncharacterized protein n=1 Tax=Escherichia coli TaxID=562 RepID=A0A8S0FTX2_ECOLX|nr:hypothetical protein EIMP300_52450 [Escherichia coli]